MLKKIVSITLLLSLTTLLPSVIHAQNNRQYLRDFKDQFVQIAYDSGYSLSTYFIFEKDNLPNEVEVDVHGGNEYMFILKGVETDKLSIIGSPKGNHIDRLQINEQSLLFSKAVDLSSYSEKVRYSFKLDATEESKKTQTKNTQDFFSGLGIDTDEDKPKNPTVVFLVLYKSGDNKGNASANKREDFFSQNAKQKEGHTSTIPTKNVVSATQEQLENDLKDVTPISPSGLKYMNGKIAIDKWMLALVREEYNDQDILSVFDVMDEEWKKEFLAYKTNFTADKIIKGTKGGVKHRGFTKDNLLVIDHTIDNKVATRYYFKIKKCDDYGRIVPNHVLKEGKLHITPWQKAIVPID